MSESGRLVPVRAEHSFDERRLGSYLRGHLPGFDGDLAVRQFEAGQSNPTFLLESGGQSWVLRKQPPGELLPGAHALDREYRVISALEHTDVPVPRIEVFCADPEVIGTIFYVMQYVEGRSFRDATLPGIPPHERRELYLEHARVAAALHSVSIEDIGLDDFGRHGNYIERQLRTWTRQYRASETARIESMEWLIEHLPERVPADDPTTLVHGDLRLENLLYDPQQPRVAAVLDWELSSLGHPFAELGYACMLYHVRFLPEDYGDLTAVDLEALGIPSESEFVAEYCERTGRDDIADWPYYVAFGMFRLAAIAQGVYSRGLQGTASSQRASRYGEGAVQLANAAAHVLGKA